MRTNIHKFISLFIFLVLVNFSTTLLGQINFKFHAEYSCAYKKLDSIKIRNVSLGVDTMLYYPDTVLKISLASIENFLAQNEELSVSKPFPNPYDEQSSILLNAKHPKEIHVSVFDMYGRMIKENRYFLETGTHSLIAKGGASSYYTVRIVSDGAVSTRNLINISGNSEQFQLLYNGLTEQSQFEQRSVLSNFKFNFGNILLMTAYITHEGQASSTQMTDNPTTSKDYKFSFNLSGCACVVGQLGPGGGYTFWCNGNNGIEASGPDTESANGWGPTYINVSGTSPNIGTGAANTEAILLSYMWSQAAKHCSDLVWNGYSDWFLPSKDELAQMYQKLKVGQNIGQFQNAEYWSSTQFSTVTAWYQDFTNGNQRYQDYQGQYSKGNSKKIRCARSF
jgi:hypothetical protein